MKQISISIAIFILTSQAALATPVYIGTDFGVGSLSYSEEIAGTNASTQKNTRQNTNQRTNYNADNLKWHDTPLYSSIRPFVGITNRTERFFLEFAMPITFSAFTESPFQVKAIAPELFFNFAILNNKFMVQPYLSAGIGYALTLHKTTEFDKRHQGFVGGSGGGLFWNIKNTGFSFNTDIKMRVFVFDDVAISVTGGLGVKYTFGSRRTSKADLTAKNNAQGNTNNNVETTVATSKEQITFVATWLDRQ